MKAGEVIRALKEALSLNRPTIMRIYELADYPMSAERRDAILARPDKKIHEEASYDELGSLLDGLIAYRRGESLQRVADDEEVILENNLILKKLRIALQLKEEELKIIFALVDREIGSSLLRDIFRNPFHPKYRSCPDDILKDFLDGLSEFYYVGDDSE